jgi:AGCS family alanine or glycine:cation symporter
MLQSLINSSNDFLDVVNGILWHDVALYVVLGTGVLFTIWSGFCQYHALTHGTWVVLGKYDRKDDPGAISHFQALSAALSATVGIGNIGGVALAVALGGPGAVFWMWVVGFFGMALKTAEVSLSMLYRNTDNPDEPHGGPMWVADLGMRRLHPALAPVGKALAVVFCITLLISTVTGGNMFQAWNVAEVTATNFPALQTAVGSLVEQAPGSAQEYLQPFVHARSLVGIILTVLCGLVIIGGIKRIGAVAGQLVPFMCIVYLLGSLYVIAVHFTEIPRLFWLIVQSAFSPVEGEQAFLGGTAGYAFLWGMKRALFSNEAGQGSSPIAHCAARTHEPIREGIVAGLEPFIDTLVVCTLTALVILASGAWNRGPEAEFPQLPQVVPAPQGGWTLDAAELPMRNHVNGTDRWKEGDVVFVVLVSEPNSITNSNRHRLTGTLVKQGDRLMVKWDVHSSQEPPQLEGPAIYTDYVGAALASHAFDRVLPGLGRWMVTAAVWLFALSTLISWSYYGEQGIVYLLGQRFVMPYRLVYCLLILIACLGLVRSDRELDNWSSLGTGVMLFANLPITLIFGYQAMSAYHSYIRRLRGGEFDRPVSSSSGSVA